MKRKAIRCSKVFIDINDLFNQPVYLIANGGWSNFRLFICSNCGELFVADFDNPSINTETIIKIISETKCPTCDVELKNYLEGYPNSLMLSNREFVRNTDVGFYTSGDTDIYEFFEIR